MDSAYQFVDVHARIVCVMVLHGEKDKPLMRIFLNTFRSDAMPSATRRLIEASIQALAKTNDTPLIAHARNERFAIPEGCTAMRCLPAARSVTMRMLWEQAWMPFRCLRDGYDLLHSFGVLPGWLPVRGVLSIANTFPFDPKTRRETRDGTYRQRMLARSIRAASIVLVPTLVHADIIRANVADLPEDLIRVLPMGAHEAFRAPMVSDAQRQNLLLKYGLPERFVLHIGPLTPRNNPLHLIQAYFAATISEGLPHRLVLVGRGHDNRNTKRFIREHGLEDKVRMFPSLPEEDLPAIMSMAACFLKPALHAGTGIALLEAMAAGTPVLATDIPIYREVCDKAAMLVPPGDLPALRKGLSLILGDTSCAADLREAGYAHAATRTHAAYAEGLLDAYHAALA